MAYGVAHTMWFTSSTTVQTVLCCAVVWEDVWCVAIDGGVGHGDGQMSFISRQVLYQHVFQ